MKIFDCITFFRENFITNLRFEILNNCVDYFVICESNYDHKGKRKGINFRIENEKFKKKVIHLVLDHQFPNPKNGWDCQAHQRDFILKNLHLANREDCILFSDPDEIPNPEKLKNLIFNKKYKIFMQKSYVYKFNIFNKFESPWEGTRACLKKNLKSIDFMRQKVLKKNLRKWWRFDKEKSIELIDNGGWHFNNCFNSREISLKLKTYAHQEFSGIKYSDVKIIEEKIKKREDIFYRGWTFDKVNLDETFPKYILQNQEKFKEFID